VLPDSESDHASVELLLLLVMLVMLAAVAALDGASLMTMTMLLMIWWGAALAGWATREACRSEEKPSETKKNFAALLRLRRYILGRL
jgi:hypothetical protein